MQALNAWMAELEARHLADLTFQEASRSVRALSAVYVERRGQLAAGAALSGRGKRAAFALFYGPLHFLLIQHIAAALDAAPTGDTLLDLGCGTGASGAAWATGSAGRAVVAIDRHPWALEEARRTYRAFGLHARTRLADAAQTPIPDRCSVLAAFVVNELAEAGRTALLPRLIAHAARGSHVLVVEPIARSVAPWWTTWRRAFETSGGRSDEWRARPRLPPLVEKLDRAAGLDHRELTARTLYL